MASWPMSPEQHSHLCVAAWRYHCGDHLSKALALILCWQASIEHQGCTLHRLNHERRSVESIYKLKLKAESLTEALEMLQEQAGTCDERMCSQMQARICHGCIRVLEQCSGTAGEGSTDNIVQPHVLCVIGLTCCQQKICAAM